jgi:hypothetical protein
MPNASEHEQHVSSYTHCPKCHKRLKLKNLKGHLRKKCPFRTPAKVLAAQKAQAAAAEKAKLKLQQEERQRLDDERRQREQEARRFRFRT